jgi:predicted  nucleic acid-binding Zn-ribbon protein
VKILKDLIKQLQKEKFELIQKYEDTQQQLNDSRSDLRLLREQIVRQRVGSFNEGLTTTIKLDFDETDLFTPFKINLVNVPSNSLAPPEKKPISTSLSTSNISSLAANNVKENLIKEIEMLREQKTTIENDLKLILCQKEEIEIERDSFKSKYLKLNEFLIASGSTDLIEKNH